MEIAIAVFIGLWLSLASILATKQLKADFKEHIGEGKVK